MRDFRASIRGLSLAVLLDWSTVGWSESEYTGVAHTYVNGKATISIYAYSPKP